MEPKAVKLNDGKKYMLLNELNVNNRLFYQLLNIEDDSDIEIVERVKEELVVLEDIDLKTKILNEMAKNLLQKKDD